MNSPYTSFEIKDNLWLFMASFYLKYLPETVAPINQISQITGMNFSHYILGDSQNNIGNKLYFPKIQGVNS